VRGGWRGLFEVVGGDVFAWVGWRRLRKEVNRDGQMAR